MKVKAKVLAVQTAPKNPKKIRTSRSHIGGWPKLTSPRVKKTSKKGTKRSLRKA